MAGYVNVLNLTTVLIWLLQFSLDRTERLCVLPGYFSDAVEASFHHLVACIWDKNCPQNFTKPLHMLC